MVSQSARQSDRQTTIQSVSQSVSQSDSQSVKSQLVSQSVTETDGHSVRYSDESVRQTGRKSVEHLIGQVSSRWKPDDHGQGWNLRSSSIKTKEGRTA